MGCSNVRDASQLQKTNLPQQIINMTELIKCRGFQVPPAEFGDHLLHHPDAAGVLVFGIPDNFSGELPLEYVTFSESAATRIKQGPQEGKKLRESIAKVSRLLPSKCTRYCKLIFILRV